MGKRHRIRRSKQNQNATTQNGERKPYTDIIRENDKFVEYYKTIGICKDNEWDEFLTAMKTDLPATFRITGSKIVAEKMLDIVQGQYLQECLNQTTDMPNSIFPLPWYPNKLAWQMNLTRKDIRRVESYYKLHNFLITETENGTISRQETVSMIPPLLLNVQSHHKILDMCAAPGSKTAQLLELLHGDDATMPSGYVIANDIDNKRCYMLVHQAKRLNSPCIAVVNQDSAIFPNLTESLTDGSTQQVQFDRILCDVPCSGDGTMRKNPDIWMKWTPANGINLHGVQLRILRRGCEMLKLGGRLVYSTCSLNPLENESVIHHLLQECQESLKLIDVSSNLIGLKFIPGMENWTLASRNLEFYDKWEDVDEKWRTTIRPQMFPPKIEDREKFGLNKCVRILPHHQNTGAFFVAVLEKIAPLSSREKSSSKPLETAEESTSKREIDEDRLPQNQRKRRRKQGYKEDPFIFFTAEEEVWPSIQKFYDISASNFDSTCLLVRCHEGKKKNIYLTSPAIKDLAQNNMGALKFINMGVKTFVRSDNRNMKDCPFRIANDGLESIFESIGPSRKIKIPKDDLITVLVNDDPNRAPKIETLSEVVQEQLKDLSPGSCVLIYTEENVDQGNPLVLYISGWRGTTTLRVYMNRCNVIHLLRLLGGDISKYEKNKFKKEGDNADVDETEVIAEKGEAEEDKDDENDSNN